MATKRMGENDVTTSTGKLESDGVAGSCPSIKFDNQVCLHGVLVNITA